MFNKFSVAIALAITLLAANTANASPRSEFHDAMRQLWIDHVTWTRLFIVSAVSDLPDQAVTTQRLLQNQTDIGNAIAEFYGAEAGQTLTALLTDHILIAANIVAAAKAGDTSTVTTEIERWKDNADDIARFLSEANPKHWPFATMREAMHMHLEQTLEEATHRLQGDHAAEVRDYDAIVEHILMMADALSNGIIAQFPRKFARSDRRPDPSQAD